MSDMGEMELVGPERGHIPPMDPGKRRHLAK